MSFEYVTPSRTPQMKLVGYLMMLANRNLPPVKRSSIQDERALLLARESWAASKNVDVAEVVDLAGAAASLRCNNDSLLLYAENKWTGQRTVHEATLSDTEISARRFALPKLAIADAKSDILKRSIDAENLRASNAEDITANQGYVLAVLKASAFIVNHNLSGLCQEL